MKLTVVFSEDFVWKIINSRNFEKKMSRLEKLMKKFEEHGVGVVPAYSEETVDAEPVAERLPEDLASKMEEAMFL